MNNQALAQGSVKSRARLSFLHPGGKLASSPPRSDLWTAHIAARPAHRNAQTERRTAIVGSGVAIVVAVLMNARVVPLIVSSLNGTLRLTDHPQSVTAQQQIAAPSETTCLTNLHRRGAFPLPNDSTRSSHLTGGSILVSKTGSILVSVEGSGEPTTWREGTGDLDHSIGEVREMRNAETILNVIRELAA